MKGCKQRKYENDMLRLHMVAAAPPKFAEMETGDKTKRRNEGKCSKESLFVMVFQNIKHLLKNAHLMFGAFCPPHVLPPVKAFTH